MRTHKPSIIAAINGAIAGLAGITPISGSVSVEHAFAIGIFASTLINPTGPNGLLFGIFINFSFKQ
jgi:ammonia channel protein AmtB